MARRSELYDDVEPWRRRVRRPRRQMPMWQEIPLLLIVAFCLAVLIRTFLLQAFFIPSGSMEDTLLIGDRVLVNKVVYDIRDPVRGEVVVFRGTDRWAPEQINRPDPGFLGRLGSTLGDLVGVSSPGEKDFIKRVIAVGGDRVACCDAEGRVTVNGQSLDEPYVLQDSPLDLPPNPAECRSRRFAEVVVPPGEIFVMGDHRLVSMDARCQGPVPVENVIGRAFVVVWPSSRWASLPVPATFADVPAPAAARAPDRIGLDPTGSDPDGAGDGVLALPALATVGSVARARRSVVTRPRRLLS
ncbi:signal peptidase I [Plantactinospora sp. GCM10030261]|uniref:signal peptidase I n=1 Tax=Plantactinospora sp. GCM10030261 TaxID=3273420 RepID=UPI00360FCA1C